MNGKRLVRHPAWFWIIAFLSFLQIGTVIGCSNMKQNEFDTDISAQASKYGDLTSIVVFRNSRKIMPFGLRSYEITSADGTTRYPIKGVGCGNTKTGWCLNFVVDSGQIPKEVERINCQFDFRVENTFFSLTSGFIRNKTPDMIGREWRVDDDCLRLEVKSKV